MGQILSPVQSPDDFHRYFYRLIDLERDLLMWYCSNIDIAASPPLPSLVEAISTPTSLQIIPHRHIGSNY